MTFAELDLNAPLLQAITDCGYTEPTPIQALAIPLALAGRDLIASAQTGTGKTAAFVLPALQRLSTFVAGPKGAPRVLVLAPTRELADQVTQATRTYGKHLRVRSAVILGGMPYRDQFRDLSRPLDLLVATPGRLIDHLNRGSLDLSRVELLILDEADRMLDMGFKDDVEKIAAATTATRQTMLFTATMDDAMAKLARCILNNPERIGVSGKKPTNDHIEQRLHVTDNLEHKNRLLQHIVGDDLLTQAIIFSATKRDADSLARELYIQGHSAAALHGDMTQNARNKTIRDLKRGKIKLLVATDVAARGLDVTGISHVINFDLPKFAEDYVHRIGRTGRAGASGIAISFAGRNDAGSLTRIERYIGASVPQHVIPGFEPSQPLRSAGGPRPAGRKGPGYGRRQDGAAAGPRKSFAGNGGQREKTWGAPKSDRGAVQVVYRNGSKPAPQNQRGH